MPMLHDPLVRHQLRGETEKANSIVASYICIIAAPEYHEPGTRTEADILSSQEDIKGLNFEIAGCERCPQRLIEYRWLPVGYFGAFGTANVWVVSINPSHREFLGKDGQLLRGPSKQRFAVLDDDLSCPSRPAFASRHLPKIIDYQDNFYPPQARYIFG